MKEVLVSGIRISARSTAAGLEKRLRGKAAGILELPPRELGKIRIIGKSIDARGREPVLLFKVAVEVPENVPVKAWEMPEAAVPDWQASHRATAAGGQSPAPPAHRLNP